MLMLAGPPAQPHQTLRGDARITARLAHKLVVRGPFLGATPHVRPNDSSKLFRSRWDLQRVLGEQ